MWKIIKEMGISDDLTCILRNQHAGQEETHRTRHGTMNWKIWNELSKFGKEYVKVEYCHLVYLTYMQRTSSKMSAWIKQKLESILPGEISITSDLQTTPPLWQKAKRS